MASEPKASFWASLFAGAGIGTLTGLIVGLSASSVTSTILGSLSTALLALLGISAARTNDTAYSQAITVAAFGFCCAAFMAAGIWLRTSDALAPSIVSQDHKLEKVFPNLSDRQRILLYQNYGLVAGASGSPQQGNASVVTTNSGGGFLRNGIADRCDYSRRTSFRDLSAYLAFLKQQDPKLEAMIESQPTSSQDQLSFLISDYLCP